jgi:nucleotide-binding universal stress UspA family protein
VVVVTAVEVGGPGAEQVGEATPAARAQGEAILAAARGRAGSQGRTVETLLGEGSPTEVILDAVRDVEPNLLAVGTRGAGPVERLLLGSVSSALVHHSPCDVLVVR